MSVKEKQQEGIENHSVAFALEVTILDDLIDLEMVCPVYEYGARSREDYSLLYCCFSRLHHREAAGE